MYQLEIDDTQDSSQESWWSWSGLTQTLDSPKGQKREFSSDDEGKDKWWKSFCSVNEFKKEESSFSQQGSSSQQTQSSKRETATEKDDKNDKNDEDENDDNEDAKIGLYLKVGKDKKIKYF